MKTKNTIEQILFSRIYLRKDNQKIPLFKNKTYLAIEIIKEKGDIYELNTLKALLSQTMLSCNKPGHRSMPDKLREVIIEVAKSRIDEKDPAFQNFEEDIENGLQDLKNKKLLYQNIQEDRLKTMKEADSYMLFLREIIDLEFLWKKNLQTIFIKSVQCCFIVSDIKKAISLWEKLTKDKNLVEDSTIKFRIYIMDYIFTFQSMEVINYRSINSQVVYNFYNTPNDFNIIKQDKEFVDLWCRDCYPKILANHKDMYKRTEITYSDYLDYKNF
jgi:hypothetical protein